jgi:hypothetical protein
MSNKFCSTSDICCVVLVKYPVTSHNAADKEKIYDEGDGFEFLVVEYIPGYLTVISWRVIPIKDTFIWFNDSKEATEPGRCFPVVMLR